MKSRPFRNNLLKGDPVFNVETKRPGVVCSNPKKNLRVVSVKYQGEPCKTRVDVMALRLLVDGKVEDVAPITGIPHEFDAEPSSVAAKPSADPITLLKSEKAGIKARIDAMNAEARTLRAREEKLDRALAALEGAA